MRALRAVPPGHEPRVVRHALGVLGALTVISGAVRAQSSTAASPHMALSANGRVAVAWASSPVHVDARLDDAAWSTAAVFELPYETYPAKNAPAPTRTECRVAADATSLYLACHAYDPAPSAIRAVRAERDDVLDQDRIGITIDPFNDRRRGWQFAITPLGVQYDAVYDAASDASDPAWNAIWTSAGRIVDDGYVIEAAIPFKSLRFPGGSQPQTWGFVAWRYRPRDSNTTLQSVPFDAAVRCVLCQAGELTGVGVAAPPRNIELGPTLTTIRTDRRLTTADLLDRGTPRVDVGADARWSVTPGATLNLTINPDFSQVEADAAQLDANQRFALSYPERRPFFLDGADLFASPHSIVFTRSITNPSGGVKLTAKAGRTAFALLGARDVVTRLLFAGHDGSSDTLWRKTSTALATRVRRDVGSASTVGVLATFREAAGGYANRVVGADALLRPQSSTSVSLQALLSDTRYPDSLAGRVGQAFGPFTGSLVGGRALYETRAAHVSASAWRYTNGFRADLGFVPQVGILEVQVDGDRILWGERSEWFTRLAIGTGYYPSRHDTATPFTNAWRFVRVAYDGPAGVTYNAYARIRTETFRGVRYDFWTPWMLLRVAPVRALSGSVEATLGGAIDYALGRLANTVQVAPSATVRLGRLADVRVRHAFLRLASGDETRLRADVSEARLAYYPTPRLSTRLLIQHRESRRTSSLPTITAFHTRSLASQLLASYRVNAQTAALLGYGDTRDAPGASPTAEAGDAREDGFGFRTMSRTFFVKLSYAWRP